MALSPTVLLPGDGLAWSPIDDTRARATLTDGGVTVSLEFRFTEAGEVPGIATPGRWGAFDGGYRRVPWEEHFRRYHTVEGMRVPAEGEVGWHLSHVWQSVWRGTVTDIRYDFAP